MARKGKRPRRPKPPATDYTDADGNVLALRDSLSASTIAQIREMPGGDATSMDDAWQRRQELAFEYLAVRWVIADLPITEQSMLLGRYRMADESTRRWVRRTVAAHAERHLPDLA